MSRLDGGKLKRKGGESEQSIKKERAENYARAAKKRTDDGEPRTMRHARRYDVLLLDASHVEKGMV